MATLNQVRANQANALKSTGPRTPLGKWIASTNAVRHGVFAKHLLLPGEDPAELSTLKGEMLQRLNPRDGLELRLVERVTVALWKLQRLQRAEQALHTSAMIKFERPADPYLHERCGMGAGDVPTVEQVRMTMSAKQIEELERLQSYEYRLENSINRTLRQLAKLQKDAPVDKLSDYAQATLAAEIAAQQKMASEADGSGDLAELTQQSVDECESAAEAETADPPPRHANLRSKPIPTVKELLALTNEVLGPVDLPLSRRPSVAPRAA